MREEREESTLSFTALSLSQPLNLSLFHVPPLYLSALMLVCSCLLTCLSLPSCLWPYMEECLPPVYSRIRTHACLSLWPCSCTVLPLFLLLLLLSLTLPVCPTSISPLNEERKWPLSLISVSLNIQHSLTQEGREVLWPSPHLSSMPSLFHLALQLPN